MSLARALAALLLAASMATPQPVEAQTGASYEVRRGDTLFGVVRKTLHDGLSRNQMILAIWRANQAAFPGGNVNVLEVGTVLAIPGREAVAAINPAEADRQVRELLARPAGAPPATVAPARPPAISGGAPAASLGSDHAIRRYREGLALERKGDDQGALKAFLEAGEAGYGIAQRKLGQIFDKGNSVVQRDYQASLRWYQKAREQGVEIDKPIPRVTTGK